MSKLIQLKLSDEKLKRYDELVDKLGLAGTFGEYQKAIEFGIDFTLSSLQEASKVLPRLDEGKLELFTASIIRLRKAEEKEEKIRELQKTS